MTQINDNQPTPEEVAADLKERIDGMTATANKWLTERGTIEDAETSAKATDFVAQLRAYKKEVTDSHAPFNKALNKRKKEVKGLFDALLAPLDVAIRKIADMQAPFLRAEQERVEREKRDAEERAAAEKAAAEQAAFEAAQSNTVDEEVAAQEAVARAKAAEREAQRAPTRAKATGNVGRSMSFRTNWYFRVTDETKVPREWLKVDETKIGKAVRRAENPVREIDGIEIYSEEQVV